MLSLGIGLFAIEWGLRRWYPFRGLIYQLDPVCLHTTIPGARRIQPMPAWAGGGRNRIVIGPEGYRGVSLADLDGRARLIVVGDSFVMAENVAYEDSLPARLEVHLGGEYAVIGLAASGYGPDQELLRLEREWEVLRPARILLVLCATNDHGDLVRNKLFRFDDAGELRPARWRFGEDLKDFFARARRRARSPVLLRLVRSLLDHDTEDRPASDRAGFIPLYLAAGEQEWQDYVGGDPVVRDLLRDYYDADLAVDPESPSAKGKRALMRAVLARWGADMKKRGVPLSIVIVPSAVDLDPTFGIRVDPEKYPAYDPRAQSQALVEEAPDTAPVLNLFELFAAHEPRELFVGREDIHWNARGIDLAAEEIARWLRAGS